VLGYIDEHLEDDFERRRVARHRCVLEIPFPQAISGPVRHRRVRYVQLARLKRASYRLAFRDGDSILQIALDSGYEGPEAFCRAFKQRLGRAPTAFRLAPHWTPW
jgi:AraC family transcriptional regulator